MQSGVVYGALSPWLMPGILAMWTLRMGPQVGIQTLAFPLTAVAIWEMPSNGLSSSFLILKY